MGRKLTFHYSAFSNITYKRDIEIDLDDEFGDDFDPHDEDNKLEIYKYGRVLLLEDIDIDWELDCE